MIIAEVLCINAEDTYINEKGAFDIAKCDLITYANGGYYTLDQKIGKFGFSVQKKKSQRNKGMKPQAKRQDKIEKKRPIQAKKNDTQRRKK